MPLRSALTAALCLVVGCGGDAGFDTDVDTDLTLQAPQLFDAHCASCHGDDGRGSDSGPDLEDRVPGLAPLDIARIITEGDGRMRPVRDVTDDEAAAISFYVVDTWGSPEE